MMARRFSDPETRPWVLRHRARRNAKTPMPKITVLDQEGRWNRNNEDEYLWWPRVLWIDPGVVSGVAVIWFDPKALLVDDLKTAKVVLAYSEMFLHGEEYGPTGQIGTYLKLREKLDEEIGLAAGCESFKVLQANSSEDFVAPIRIRSGIQQQMSCTRPLNWKKGEPIGVPLFTQSPSDAINAFTNERLKALRMYTPGPDHINDAKRHCLLWIRRLKAHRDPMAAFRAAHGYEEGWFA
ncbi:resolvase [Microbacterium phage Krampus]|uniref:Resolvase n=5 Tax=Krampusvirus krampus TaxID=2734242 RepID=A0A2Z4Q4R8_9CAUD|nr:resolvase [Microbacterium phage Krampus]AWY04528.1 resolvase [Microbacterium phage AnnaSerena]AWY05169.1 resolvase [Microbacterium phage Krampus]QDF18207.1 RuvC-like resolvase [Microbacterium phage NarutoRun]URP21739.1 RuvC-like resolvase [Microbacterium phage Kate]